MRSSTKNNRGFNRLPLAIAMLSCLYGTSALAQEAPTSGPSAQAQTAPQDDQDQQADQTTTTGTEPTELDKITVTGSLLKRAEYESASPIQVIEIERGNEVGQVDTAEFVQQSSVASGSTQINNQFGGFVIEGGLGVQTISLRGLGANRTLVLLDGHRPGPSGTRGQVGAFDLSVIPSSILGRIEILKDGASSTYGSDAVAGVVNLITRKTIDRPELTFKGQIPFHGGGESFSVSGATGWNFDNGSIVLGAEYLKFKPLKTGDRDYFSCPRDLVKDSQGNLLDREDRSVTAGTKLSGCNNLYANTVIQAVGGSNRYIQSPDGTTIGLIPGYRPRTNGRYNTDGTGQAYYEDQLNYDFYKSNYIVNDNERTNVFAASNFALGNVNWNTQLLYNHRRTESRRYRQFFPLVGNAPDYGLTYANDPGYVAPVPPGFYPPNPDGTRTPRAEGTGLGQPILPFRFNSSEDIDYFYVDTSFDGLFGGTDTWGWNVNGSYSRSDGDYTGLGIVASRSGDVQFDDNSPSLDYFAPGFLNGERIDELEAAIGQKHTGNTVYDQSSFTGVVTGDLFTLPAGAVSAAFGAEYRRFSIDDQPSDLSQNGDLWGSSSAQVTKGTDHVTEVFAEFEVPLLKGLPGVESLTANVSGRRFEYDSVGESDNVWKAGLSWQVIPSLKLRATKGTSYRAPGLYELYLGDQTGFLSQLSIDPCILYQDSTNANLRQNCAAAGIAPDYTGGAASATVVSGGGLGVLKPETSLAKTVGIVFTPTFADVSIAIDYFSFEVNDQISQLGAGAILGGCYGSPNYPNAFCDLFDRNPGTDPQAPFAITEVRDSYLNVNKQKTRGYDIIMDYNRDLAAGKLSLHGEATYVMEDFELLFDSEVASGFDKNDFNGDISRPRWVGNLRTQFESGDWKYTYLANYVQGTEALNVPKTASYFSFPNAVYDTRADARLYHTVSVKYSQPDWSIIAGIQNLLDTRPPQVSSGVVSTFGNVPAFATQYDLYGRTGFVTVNYKF